MPRVVAHHVQTGDDLKGNASVEVREVEKGSSVSYKKASDGSIGVK